MRNKIKRKAIEKIFALTVVGLFIVLALAPSAVGDPCDVWNRDPVDGEIYPLNSLNDEVGIGDDDPDFKLEVAVTSGDGYLGVSSAAGNDGDIFIIDTNGRLGIGDTSPDFKLEVTGSSGSGYFGVSSSSYLDFLLSCILDLFF
jgi:hypothetical protein